MTTQEQPHSHSTPRKFFGFAVGALTGIASVIAALQLCINNIETLMPKLCSVTGIGCEQYIEEKWTAQANTHDYNQVVKVENCRPARPGYVWLHENTRSAPIKTVCGSEQWTVSYKGIKPIGGQPTAEKICWMVRADVTGGRNCDMILEITAFQKRDQ